MLTTIENYRRTKKIIGLQFIQIRVEFSICSTYNAFSFPFQKYTFFLYTAYYKYSDSVYEQPASNTKEQLNTVCVKVFN